MHDYFEGLFILAHVDLPNIHFLWLCPCTRSACACVCVLLSQLGCIQVFIVLTIGLLHVYFVCCVLIN